MKIHLGKRRRFSLQWGLTVLVIGCWLIPIYLIIVTLTHFTTTRTRQYVDDNLLRTVSGAANSTRRELEALIEESRHASTDGEIHKAYLQYQVDGSQVHLYDTVTNYLGKNYRYNDALTTTMVYFVDEPDELYVMHNPTITGTTAHLVEYQKNLHEEIVELAAGIDTHIYFYANGDHLYLIRNMLDKRFDSFAVIIMLLNNDSVFEGFNNITGSTGILIDLLNTSLYIQPPREDSALVSFQMPVYTDIGRGTTLIENFDDFTIFYGRESFDTVHMLYQVEIDRNFFTVYLNELYRIVVLLLLMIIPLAFFTVWFFYRNILSPINRLTVASRNIREGELGYMVEEEMKNKEFTLLAKDFNRMSAQLKEQFEHIYNEELALRDARIMALQSQINPHFLNNTLEIINWETHMGQNAKVSEMIKALSTMLDAAMDRKSSPMVSLSQEMMYVDAYLYIISERFGKRLTVQKEIDKSLFSCMVPRLIMQPIIENAVEHGMTPYQTASITIRVRREEDRICLEVENNMPMSEADRTRVDKLLSPSFAANSEEAKHLGIRNVNMRLRMIYGDSYGLSITSTESSTISAIHIPIENTLESLQ